MTVSAPSRLHFGLLSIGQQSSRMYGGAGLMINSPRTIVRTEPADRLSIVTEPGLIETVAASLESWQRTLATEGLRELPPDALPVKISVEPVKRHSGLGSGTQLAFAIATAMQLAFKQPIPSSEELALAMGRGKRSAIGSYGFHQGGFLVDRGILDEEIAPLDMRIDFPWQWHVALIVPRTVDNKVVAGRAELEAFKNLPPTPESESRFLASLLSTHIVPSVLNEDFPHFAASVTEYGYRSGLFYSPIQGGAYASPAATRIVDTIKSVGEFAVGQSSWGPAIFAIGPSEKEVNWLVDQLHEHCDDEFSQATVVAPDNHGLRTEIH